MLKKTHKAFNTNVIVRETSVDGMGKSAGGIIMATEEIGGKAEGIIMDIGPNAFDDFGDRRPGIGDLVVYARYAGKELDVYEDGNIKRIMRDIDVLCSIITEEV